VFIIPMVGRSSRFFNEGYSVPKYQLPLAGRSVFSHVLDSFTEYFHTDHFRFLCRADHQARDFIERELHGRAIKSFDIIEFDRETRGQADTIHIGTRDLAPDVELYVFNIDTFRPGFRKAPFASNCAGYLEVFRGSGAQWSFVDPGPDGRVLRTTEKERISDLCSDGLYYFARKDDFETAFLDALSYERTVKGEYFVAPLYNHLIEHGKVVRYCEVAEHEVVFCGAPDEYRRLLGTK
jgi:NDP-sugar pyrophosphorylase family protein